MAARPAAVFSKQDSRFVQTPEEFSVAQMMVGYSDSPFVFFFIRIYADGGALGGSRGSSDPRLASLREGESPPSSSSRCFKAGFESRSKGSAGYGFCDLER